MFENLVTLLVGLFSIVGMLVLGALILAVLGVFAGVALVVGAAAWDWWGRK